MQVTVVISTYNRARLLEGALGALAAQEVPPAFEWEIVVIDNNSSDATARVVAAFAEKAAVPVRRVFEPSQGLSRARNRGVREARGAIVAFIDDDVLPAPDWVAQVAAAMARWNADGVGGRILAKWEAPPPPWLVESRRLLRQLAIMDFEGSRLLALPLESWPQVWGANMAFRRELFDRVGNFDPRRGLYGRRLFRGEEADFIDRALALGSRIAYDSAITVFHRIGADRTRKGYFRRMAFDSAQGEARVTPATGERTFLGAPTAAYRGFFVDLRKWMFRLARPWRPAFDHQLRWLESVGRLTGYWTPHRHSRAE
jgi:glucosyl-dolichyl phosphate glucuronosyltransferase